jgi:pilus assembly protein CpaE
VHSADRAAADAPREAEAARALPLNRPLAAAYTGDPESEGVLRAGLSELDGALSFQRGTIQTAIRDLSRNATPQVLIVDVSGTADPLVALDDLANVCEPDVKVLVIGDRTDVGFYREITRSLGVIEYLYKPLTRDNVARLFLPIVKGRMPGGGAQLGGRVITVTAAHGGAGATTVASNLAIQLAETSRGYVALVDLNLQDGATALALGIAPGAGLRVALEEPGRVDELFLERTAVSVSDRLRLLAADEALEATPRPTEEGVGRLMTMLRRRFNYVIVDMPNPAEPALRSVYKMAQTRLLVLTPDVISLRGAKRFRSMLAAATGDDRAIALLNHAGMPGGLSTTLIEQGLAEKPALSLPHLPKHVLAAANLGVAAVTRSRVFQSAMSQVTREVSGQRARKEGWLARLLRR